MARPGFDRFFCSWVARGDLTLLVDAGPARSADTLIQRLKVSGLKHVDYVLLTHIHLDHAGGLFRVLEAFPGARVVCHRKAVPHLVDPRRLWAGSLKVLGDMAEAYGAPLPVAEEALIAHDEADIENLHILETPGHAPHHISFSCEGTLFAGEAGGIYTRLEGGEILRPATPPRFYLEECLAGVDRLRDLKDQVICYAHFGKAESSRYMLERFHTQLLRWRDLLASVLRTRPDAGVGFCVNRLLESDPELEHVPDLAPEIRERERFFLRNSVEGYLEYLRSASGPPLSRVKRT